MQDAKNICSIVSCSASQNSAVLRTAQVPPVCDHPGVAHTVLIVDDHPSFRASARAILEEGDYQVVGEVSDGTSALSAVEALHPDVVLLDVQLPDMTGFDICGLLERGNGSAPAIVLVSSRDESDYGELVETSCARGFIPKAELSAEAIAALIA
jgi:DNA-binding NarL/FixJ family response regulator